MPTEAPYMRIVAEIRDRIASGRLGPGQRIPSTRQITQEWGVAMATATKVIAALRDEGLVVTRPGAGTTVRSVAVVDVVHQQELTRDRIVRTAIALADADGLAAVSMRKVALELGVATMSLYRHVASKDDLVLYMGDFVAGEEPFPARAATWRANLEIAARLLWTLCRRHHWLAEVFSMTRPRPTANLLDFTEWALSTLLELGLPPSDTAYVYLNLFNHVRAMALTLSAEHQARQDSGITNEEWMQNNEAEFYEIVSTKRYPAMEHMVTLDFDQDLDDMFEFGLQLLLDGVALRLQRRSETVVDDPATQHGPQ